MVPVVPNVDSLGSQSGNSIADVSGCLPGTSFFGTVEVAVDCILLLALAGLLLFMERMNPVAIPRMMTIASIESGLVILKGILLEAVYVVVASFCGLVGVGALSIFCPPDCKYTIIQDKTKRSNFRGNMIEQAFLNVLVVVLWSILSLMVVLRFFRRSRKNNYRKVIVLSGGIVCTASAVHSPGLAFAQSDDVDSWRTTSAPTGLPSVPEELPIETTQVPLAQEPNAKPKVLSENVDETNSLTLEKYVVVQGDNLWSIAKMQAHNNENFIELWKQIISINSENLQSKNPNLIYPGEEIVIRK